MPKTNKKYSQLRPADFLNPNIEYMSVAEMAKRESITVGAVYHRIDKGTLRVGTFHSYIFVAYSPHHV